MRTIHQEMPVFNESDLERLAMKIGDPIGQFDVLEMGFSQRYLCIPLINKGKKEYQVIHGYHENGVEPERLRKEGAL